MSENPVIYYRPNADARDPQRFYCGSCKEYFNSVRTPTYEKIFNDAFVCPLCGFKGLVDRDY